MSFIPKNPLIMPEVETFPSPPSNGLRGFVSGKDGWYDIDSQNNIKKFATDEEVDELKSFYDGYSEDLMYCEFTAEDIEYLGVLVVNLNCKLDPNETYFYECSLDGIKYNGTCQIFESDGGYCDIALGSIACAHYSPDNIVGGFDYVNLEFFLIGTGYVKIFTEEKERKTLKESCLPDNVVTKDEMVTTEDILTKDIISNSYKYYGNAGIVPSDQSLFSFQCDTNAKTAMILKYTGSDSDVIVPYEYIGADGTSFCVTEISSNCFVVSNLTSVIIPSTVVSIGGNAFAHSYKLTNVTILGHITSIDNGTFSDCNKLTTLILPNTIETIGDGAFNMCDVTDVFYEGSIEQWKNISISSLGNTVLGNAIIHYNYDITPATKGYVDEQIINDSRLKNHKYYGNMDIIPSDLSLFKISLNNTTMVATISKYTGSDGDVVIPYEYTTPNGIVYSISINNKAFQNNTILKTVIFPNNTKTLSDYIFSGCTNLTSVIIPDSVTSIGNRVFENCTSLENITIPQNVKAIGNYVFYGCTKLKNILLPEHITTIEDRVFRGCTELTSITIPNGVTTIQESAFYDCKNLSSITIPESVSAIGIRAFYDCNKLTNIYYEGSKEQWEKISIDATGNTVLTKAIIHYNHTPATEGYVDEQIKNIIAIDTTELEKALNSLKYYDDISVVPTSSELFTYNDNGNGTCTITSLVDPTLTSVVIPYEINGLKVTNIGTVAFETVPMSSVIIPNTVTTIEYGAFQVAGIKNITIPDSVISLESSAFCWCTGLEHVVIGNGVTSIEDYTFTNSYNLISVVIPDAVTRISKNAFGFSEDWDGSTELNVTIICNSGSYAETYAKENGIAYKINPTYVDQNYNPESNNAQSGKAVAEAINNVSAPTKAFVNILGGVDNWIAEDVLDDNNNIIGSRYGQAVNVNNAVITANSKVDLQITSEQMVVFYEKSLAFVAENDDGVVSVYCVGDIPENNYTIQATVTEVTTNG